jgi:hypothetical protein
MGCLRRRVVSLSLDRFEKSIMTREKTHEGGLGYATRSMPQVESRGLPAPYGSSGVYRSPREWLAATHTPRGRAAEAAIGFAVGAAGGAVDALCHAAVAGWGLLG